MSIAFIDSVSAGPAPAGGSTSAIDTTGATLIVASVGRLNSGTLTDSESNTWTLASSPGINTTTQEYYYCISPTTSASHTFTYSGSNTFPGISVAAYSGDLSFDAIVTKTTVSATSQQSSPLTPDQASSVLVIGLAHTDTNAMSIDSSFTEREDLSYSDGNNFAIYLADKILVSAAEESPTITGVSSTDYVSAMASFVEVPPAGTLVASAITSAEAFGTAAITNEIIKLRPSSIGTSEQFGTATVSKVVNPSSVVSSEAFGTATVEDVSTDIDTSGISSEEAFGSPTLGQPQPLLASGIQSEEEFGNASVGTLQYIVPTGIPSEEGFGSHFLGITVIQSVGIASSGAFGVPTTLSSSGRNYYGTIQRADAFFSGRLNSFDWDNSSEGDKLKSLQHAKKLIDRFDYIGQKYSVQNWLTDNADADLTTAASKASLREAELAQPCEFPRGVSNIVPREIERAAYLIAKALLSGRDPNADLEDVSVRSEQYGMLNTSYNTSGNDQHHLAHLIPSPQAFNLIRPFFRDRNTFDIMKT